MPVTVLMLNFAVSDMSLLMVIFRVEDVPLTLPLQFAKTEPEAGVAISLTTVPLL